MAFTNFYNKRIFLDMDGTITDFKAQFLRMSKTGMTPDRFKEVYGEEELIEEIKKYGEEFWSTMPWMEDGVFLWNYIDKYKPIILTRPIDTEECVTGKEWWVKANLPMKTEVIFEKDKEIWADPFSILIDDKGSNVRKFIIKEGHGIIHISAVETIRELKEKFGL